jgi:hypothetical protein
MKNWENMVEYYRNNPEARRNILKHAGLLNEEPMKGVEEKKRENTDK